MGLSQHMTPQIIRSNFRMSSPTLMSATVRRSFCSTNNASAFPSRFFSSSWMRSAGSSRAQSQSTTFRRFFNSSRPRYSNTSHPGKPASLSQRLKMLSKEYGWSALGVYLLLSAMDFPICFAAVHFVGADRMGHYEQVVVDTFKAAVGTVMPSVQEAQATEEAVAGDAADDQSVTKAEKKTGEEASLWTQIVIAYAIHKSLIFIRVPLTAAITPKVVKALRHWGWDLVKGKPKGM
ncbi:hypothetical protein FE257_003156 [Aspergillus nanangensis]|uniref:DUF1279 domain-containing protein n=1 Tax=Aspergillus nanangensis TaxID=2582783 RepID=A0AAD4GPQ6_ASPNN|nr:hypothetical protein FE257_003156 [Aspergillus nanangensis]